MDSTSSSAVLPEATSIKASIDLLLCSTDSYLEVALLSLREIQRLGLDELMDINLLVGDAKPTLPAIRIINRNKAGTWSSELAEGLGKLEKEYVLLWIDDCVPVNVPSMNKLVAALEWMVRTGGNYLRLNPIPRGSGVLVAPGIRECLPGELYRTSTPFSVWKRSALESLLKESESAWEFELIGGLRSDRFGRFFASDRWLLNYENLVVKGLVDPRSEERLERSGVRVDGIKRRRMSPTELLSLRIRDFRAKGLRILPNSIRRTIRMRFGVYGK